MKELLTEDSKIHVYGMQDIYDFETCSADYIICQVDVLDSIYENTLTNRGFQFHDRIFYMEIDLQQVPELRLQGIPQEITFNVDNQYSEDVYELAYDSYVTDRRFHLEPVFDQKKAIPVIRTYIDSYKGEGLKIYKAKYKEELLGYTIVRENRDSKKAFFENVIGVTAPNIRGKAIAGPLYTTMLLGEKNEYKRYVGRVSASNASSVNLHYQLGGRVIKIYDEFIYRSNSQKSNTEG